MYKRQVFYLIGYSTFLFISVVVGASVLYRNRYLEKMKNELKHDYYVPVSVIVPAHNEEVTVVDTVRSLLQLDYKLYEVLVVDDGSTDKTSQRLIKAFNLIETQRPIRLPVSYTHLYWLSHTGTIYSKKFNVSLVTLTILTATVMAIIGNNIALSLGMVGALSIVRFRTAIKDSRDTVYIFWTIVAGLGCGVGDYVTSEMCIRDRSDRAVQFPKSD